MSECVRVHRSLSMLSLYTESCVDDFIQALALNCSFSVICACRCKPLHWIPFAPDEDPETDTTDPWAMGPEVLAEVSFDTVLTWA